MTCPGCQRQNQPHRRYCGGCGCNLAPVCRQCSFANEGEDRYCGGCGELLTAGAGEGTAEVAAAPAPRAPPAPTPPPAPPRARTRPTTGIAMRSVPPAPGHVSGATAVHPPSGDLVRAPAPGGKSLVMPDELSGLFTPPPAAEESPLPDGTIAQADLDRLFGGAP